MFNRQRPWAAVAMILCAFSAFLARAAETPGPNGSDETRNARRHLQPLAPRTQLRELCG